MKAICFLAAVLLSACAMGPDYVRPSAALPGKYPEAAEAVKKPVADGWWKLFNDPTLDGLIEEALKNNADIQLAVARIEEADGVMREVGAALLPEVDLGVAATKNRVSNLSVLPFPPFVRQDYRMALSTNFELDFWGKLRRGSEAARAQAMATRYARDTVRLSLTSLIAQTYLALRSLDVQIGATQGTAQSLNESLKIVRSRLEGGVASGIDLEKAGSALNQVESQLSDLKLQRSLLEHQLALLTGGYELKIASGDLLSLGEPPVPPAGLPSALLESRPDIAQAEELLIAANAKIGVAKAAMFPSISLTGNFGAESQALSDIQKGGAKIWSLGYGLNLPIFDAGRLSAREDQAAAQQKQALASYQKSIQTGFKEVNDALVSISRDTEGEAALKMRLDSARKALALVEARYQSGYSPYLDLLDARHSLNDATFAYAHGRQLRLSATVDLIKALGGGWKKE